MSERCGSNLLRDRSAYHAMITIPLLLAGPLKANEDALRVQPRERPRHEEAHAKRQHFVVEVGLGMMSIDAAQAEQHVSAGAEYFIECLKHKALPA